MKKITTFWNWFQKNEQEIFHALVLGIKTDAVLALLYQKLDYVSKRIDYVIQPPKTIDGKFTIVFTGGGYRKLFPKMIAFENQAPVLKHFCAQAFIKPLEDSSMYRDGTDAPCVCQNFEIKISEVQMALLDYNVTTKKIKINIYLPEYDSLQQFDDLKPNINWIIIQIIGEIAYRKHIRAIQLLPMPLEPVGLLPLIELPDFISYLYQINSRKKTRLI
jgi:hypothetical protein